MPKTVTFVRHGQSEHNAAVLAGAVGDPGFFDARLTVRGEAQVVTLAAQMAAVRVEAVIVSPLTRALQTAWGAFGGSEPKAPFHVDAQVRERLENSCDIGRAPGELSADFPALDFGHLGDVWWHSDGSDAVLFEPDDVLQGRVERFREWLRACPFETLAVVGHGTFFRQLVDRRMENGEALVVQESEGMW